MIMARSCIFAIFDVGEGDGDEYFLGEGFKIQISNSTCSVNVNRHTRSILGPKQQSLDISLFPQESTRWFMMP